MQLEVQGLDKIYRDGTDVDDCLVLGLQGWLKGENTSWEQLITAIFQPAGGGNQLLAQHVATSVKGIYIQSCAMRIMIDLFSPPLRYFYIQAYQDSLWNQH